MPNPPCLFCNHPITRNQRSNICARCKSLAHVECASPQYLDGFSYLPCCSPPALASKKLPVAPTLPDAPTTPSPLLPTATALSAAPLINRESRGAPSTTIPSPQPSTSGLSTRSLSVDVLAASDSPPCVINQKRKASDSSPSVDRVNKISRTASAAHTSTMTDPPAWFIAYEERQDEKQHNQTKHLDSKIDTLTSTVTGLQQSLRAAEEERERGTEEKNRQIELLRNQMMLIDDLEVVIIGLPIAFTDTYEQATHMLYTALGLSQNKIP